METTSVAPSDDVTSSGPGRVESIHRPQRATAGQKRYRLYDNIADEALSRAPSIARHQTKPSKPLPQHLPPLDPPSAAAAAALHTIGWARSKGFPHWPCVVVHAPSVVVEFPDVHATFVRSAAPRKILVQYFGMSEPQFEVASAPEIPTDEDLADYAGTHPSATLTAFHPWGCPRQIEFEGNASKIASSRSSLRRAFQQGLLEARAVFGVAPSGGPLAAAALTAVKGIRVFSALAPAPAPKAVVNILPGTVTLAKGRSAEPARPITSVEEVWGRDVVDDSATEDEA